MDSDDQLDEGIITRTSEGYGTVDAWGFWMTIYKTGISNSVYNNKKVSIVLGTALWGIFIFIVEYVQDFFLGLTWR